MKTKLFSLILLLISIIFSAQNIKFVSSNSGAALPQLIVFDNFGKILTESNMDGIISTEYLIPF